MSHARVVLPMDDSPDMDLGAPLNGLPAGSTMPAPFQAGPQAHMQGQGVGMVPDAPTPTSAALDPDNQVCLFLPPKP